MFALCSYFVWFKMNIFSSSFRILNFMVYLLSPCALSSCELIGPLLPILWQFHTPLMAFSQISVLASVRHSHLLNAHYGDRTVLTTAEIIGITISFTAGFLLFSHHLCDLRSTDTFRSKTAKSLLKQ